MKGKYGVPMSSIECAERKHYGEDYNHKCADCIFLEYKGGRGCPYKCVKKNKSRYYTSKVWCRLFKHK